MKLHRFEAGRQIVDAGTVTARLRTLFEEAGLVFEEDGLSYPKQWNYEAAH